MKREVGSGKQGAGSLEFEDMNKEISPEERLFNVIKEGKNLSNPLYAKNLPGAPAASMEMPLPFDIQVGMGSIDFKKVNKVLTIILILLMAVVVFTCVHKKEISVKRLSATSLGDLQATNVTPAQTYQPVNFYIKQVKKRDLFHPVKADSGVSADNAPIVNKDFSLSGIYMGQYPQAIITDKAEQKAYFLKEGDDIKGYKVKSILKNKVILQQGDEEIELI